MEAQGYSCGAVGEVARLAGKTPVYIGVVGAAQCSDRLAETAAAVGQEIAQRGGVVVCGGRGGVMAAAARGAAAAGGVVLGILPEDDRAGANPHLTYSIPTGLGQARNVIVVLASDALVAVGGGFGTLSEIASALKLGVPVVGLDSWGFSPPVDAPPLAVGAYARASTPAEAVEIAWRAAAARTPSRPPYD